MSTNSTATTGLDTEYTINSGDTGWVLICSALVFLMVINKQVENRFMSDS
jgi:hypothetical protein